MKKFLAITHKSLEELGASSYQELWQKAQGDGYSGISLHVTTKYKKSADDDALYNAIFSSANEDRHGDIVEQNFDTKGFRKNPVFLDSHNYGSINAILGKVVKLGVRKSDGKLAGQIKFATDTPQGELASRLAAGGYLGATSIGFIPKEFDDDGNIKKSELLEISAVSVPANADAIFEEKGITPADTENADGTQDPEDPETPQDEAEDNETVEDTEPAEKTAQKPKMSRKAIAAKAVNDLVTVRRSKLKAISQAVHQLNRQNQHKQRRKVHQAVRAILDE